MKKPKDKVLLDTNVLVSAFIVPGGNPHQIVEEAMEGSFQLFSCQPILTEARRVLLEYEHIRKRYEYTDQEVEGFLANLKKGSTTVGELPSIRVVKEDPDDDKILACAKKGEVDYLISGDPHLKELEEYQGIKILPPADFVESLEKGD